MNKKLKAAIAVRLVLGLLISTTARAEAPLGCDGTLPPTMQARYSASGKLVEIEDHVRKSHARFFWDGPLVSVSETEFKLKLSKPDKYGRVDMWGPRRSTDYNSKTGQLSAIHTHEKFKIVENKKAMKDPTKPGRGDLIGFQTSYYNLEGVDFTKLRGADGVIRYNGPAVSENADYVPTPLGSRDIVVTEPLNIKEAQCYPFEGQRVPLSLPAPKAKIVEEKIEPKHPATDSKIRRVCIEGGCIDVHEDDEVEITDDDLPQSVQ